MLSDTIADFLTRLRNAAMASKLEVTVRPTRLINDIAQILKSEGFIDEINVEEGQMNIKLSATTRLEHLKKISRPSLRRYSKVTDIPRPKSGYGLVILSTPKGVLAAAQARKQRVGGELICEVW